MNDCSELDEQSIKGQNVTVGNDGCTVISVVDANSFASPKTPVVGLGVRSTNKSIMQSIKEAFSDDFHFESSPEYKNSLKNIVINGKNILSFSSEDVDQMSLDEVKLYLSQLQLEGNLRKKGFRGFQMWRRRYFKIVNGSLLYYDIGNLQKPRKSCVITMGGKVMVENIQNHPFAFSIRPFKDGPIYIVDAYSTQQRDQWIRSISFLIMLNRRLHSTSQPPSSFHKSLVLLDQLGRGRFGVVRLAQSRTTGEMYAVKVISKNGVDLSILRQELAVLRAVKERIHDSHTVRIYEIYEDPLLVHIVLEYMGGGDLYHRLLQKKIFSEKEAANVIKRIGSALASLHAHNIYHLDVKPENIIYESNDTNAPMKLTDFGCSLLADHYNHDTNEIVGTAGFMAPEVIQHCAYSPKADVYSLGVTLFILLMGYPPFRSENPMELLEMTCKQRIEYNPEDWSTVSEDALLLVKNMLAKNPAQRVSMSEVLEFNWVNHPPSSTEQWRQRILQKQHMSLPMSFPSTLPSNSMLSV